MGVKFTIYKPKGQQYVELEPPNPALEKLQNLIVLILFLGIAVYVNMSFKGCRGKDLLDSIF